MPAWLLLPSVAATPKPRSPPMGWSSWNAFYCNVHEDDVKANADLLVSMGLRDLGYSYVNVDDCWSAKDRGASGELVPDPDAFGSGIPALAKHMHDRNLSLGLYTSQTSATCAGRAGVYGHEAADSRQYCGWGVDYLKIDLCGGEAYADLNTSWVKFAAGLGACAHPIEMSVEYCGAEHPGGPAGTDPVSGCGAWIGGLADLWRTSSDLQPTWDSVYATAKLNDQMAGAASVGPGHFNDPDMLQVANFLFADGNECRHVGGPELARRPDAQRYVHFVGRTTPANTSAERPTVR